MRQKSIAVIIVAAGKGERASADSSADPKQYRPLAGIPVLARTISAFLDLFVTRGGVAVHPEVVDYYRGDEPIELGPDENMHDVMIEAIAAL